MTQYTPGQLGVLREIEDKKSPRELRDMADWLATVDMLLTDEMIYADNQGGFLLTLAGKERLTRPADIAEVTIEIMNAAEYRQEQTDARQERRSPRIEPVIRMHSRK